MGFQVRKIAKSYSSNLLERIKNTKFKNDFVLITDTYNIAVYIFETGKHNVDKSDLKNFQNT